MFSVQQKNRFGIPLLKCNNYCFMLYILEVASLLWTIHNEFKNNRIFYFIIVISFFFFYYYYLFFVLFLLYLFFFYYYYIFFFLLIAFVLFCLLNFFSFSFLKFYKLEIQDRALFYYLIIGNVSPTLVLLNDF